MQVFLQASALNEAFTLFKNSVELGDFIEVTGTVFLTKQDEKTLAASSWKILTKAIRPIPTEHFGMNDEEELLRRRYLFRSHFICGFFSRIHI